MNDEQDRASGKVELVPQDLGIGRLFWVIRDAVVVGDAATGRIVLWNPAAERLFGYPAAEVIGQPIDILVPDTLKPRHHAGLARYAVTGSGPLLDSGTPVELPARHRDGAELAVELTLAPIESETVPGQFVLAVIRDATARKRAEAERLALAREQAARTAAEAGQRRLAFLAEASAVLAASLDYAATLTTVARLAVPVLGAWCVVYVRGDDGAIQRLAMAAADADRLALIEAIKHRFALDPAARSGVPRVIRTGQPELHGEEALALLAADVDDQSGLAELLDGWDISAWMCVPLSARGQTFGALAFVADGGRRYASEDLELAEDLARRAAIAIDNARLFRAAQAAEARYRELFEGVADAILVADEDGRIRDANQAALNLLGARREDLCHSRMDHLLTAAQGREAAGTEAAHPKGRWQGEVELRRGDGTTVPVEVRTARVELPTGPVSLSALRDITERQQLDRLQRDFLAMVTHDLRTPLTGVRVHAQVLARQQTYRRANVDAILAATDRMTRLIADLADLVRLEGRELPLRRAAVDLVHLVRSAVQEAQALTSVHRIELVTPERAIVGEWDADRIGQVLQNLVGNAVQHAPETGTITVRVAAGSTDASITVTDRGPGIAPEHLPHLFERFYRAGATGAGGLGLGLYISRLLVEAHGGRIWAESTPGNGSTFTVVLPRS